MAAFSADTWLTLPISLWFHLTFATGVSLLGTGCDSFEFLLLCCRQSVSIHTL